MSLQEEDEVGAAVPQARGVETLYAPSESIFAAAAPAMVELGWSVFPQESTGERRMPGRVLNQTIKWREDHDLSNKLPTQEALDLWCGHCATLNVACVFGPASGNTFAIDIDAMDPAVAAEITDLADEILGYTPLRREGRAPKIALIYRHGPGERDRVPSLSRKFAAVDGAGESHVGEDGIEILGATKLITFHGRHHKTGTYFKWLDASPLLVGPSAAPEVSPERVQTFLEAVDARFRFHRGASFNAASVTWDWDEATRMMVPNLRLAAGGAAWSEGPDGLVSDGREAYLTSLVFRTLAANLPELDAAVAAGGDALSRFKGGTARAVTERFEATAAMTGRWVPSKLRYEAGQKVSHLVDKYARGDADNLREAYRPSRREGRSTAELQMPREHEGDPELSFLPPGTKRVKDKQRQLRGHVEPPPADGPDLSIQDDRGPIASTVQTGLLGAFRSFFSDVYGAPEAQDPDCRRSRVHVLKAPTGAGKTSRGIRFIAEDPRTYQPFEIIDPETGERRESRAPLVMLLPTYNNIDELRSRAKVLNLDGTLPDAELRRAAADLGLIAEDELDAKIAELRRDAMNCADLALRVSGDDRGLVTMTYSGKIKAGCKVEDKVKLAMEAGIGTAPFCKATRQDDDGNTVEDICPFFDGCPAIAQRAEISQAHVVFMPHSFLSLTIPEELKEVRAVVADERIHHLFLHTATFSAMSLHIARKPPRLTKREKAEGMEPGDLLADRNLAADIALVALRNGECPAQALWEWRDEAYNGDGDRRRGHMVVQSALRVCGSAIQRDGNLTPSMPIEEVRELCSRPTGKDVREEWRFWSIIQERMQQLEQDKVREDGLRALERDLAGFQGDHDLDARLRLERRLERARTVPVRARGSRDLRIQYLTDHAANGSVSETVRISWRTAPNWLGVPMLLLDASAAPEIVAKVWNLPVEDIVVHDIVEDIGLSLNVKIVGVVNQTFSNASLIASPSGTEAERVRAARNLANVRQALSSVAALYGDGRVVAGTSIVLREAIANGWACPDNVDWCHYGAMRGLDMFKFHGAAFSVGRMEVPTRTIDGLVAALTYDDELPELPYDRTGTGMDPEDPRHPLMLPHGPQRLRLRTGHVAVLSVPTFPGRWGRLIQRQYREEELLQFVGRLRPVYREGRTPVWFALSSVIPEELIVDDLIHIDDLLNGSLSPSPPMDDGTPVSPKPTAPLWEACRVLDGVLSPDLAAAACPDSFPDAGRARRLMLQAGFSREAKEPEGREARGFASFRWWPLGSGRGQAQVAFVRAAASEPERRLRDALRKHLGVEAEVERLWSPPETTAVLARPRPADSVDLRIGDRNAREEGERRRLERIGAELLDVDFEVSAAIENLPRRFAWERSAGQKVSMAEMNALFAIGDHWRAKAGVADDRLMPMVQDAPSEVVEGAEYATYEQLGGGYADDDALPAAARP